MMEYSIRELADLAGISTRTLRYYDEINLLKPARMNHSGYRVYTQREVDLLQQIMFYRELDVSLEQIKSIINDPAFDKRKALTDHYKRLLERRDHLDKLIAAVKKTIAHENGEVTMNNKEKFQAFKERLIQENEAKFGKEVREKYGDEAAEQSNAKLLNLSEEQYHQMQETEKEMFACLKQAMEIGDPASEPARKAAAKHKEWLSFTWPQYSKEAHANLVDMYVADERFTAYYDRHGSGTAQFLRDAVHHFIKS